MKELTATAKRDFYESKIAECSTTKALFHIAGTLSGKKISPSFPSFISKQELPNKLAHFFKEKVTNIRHDLDGTANNEALFSSFCGTGFSGFRQVTTTDVMNVIRKSPPKSCSLDPIPTTLLVTHLDSLIDIITMIINDSLQHGYVPDPFKNAVVTPILKKTSLSSEDLKNFRPVSNLPFLSKILEKIVLAQLKEHLENNNLNEENQSAYRANHSTETCLLKIQNDLLVKADENNISLLVLLDLSAVFDTIDHTILINGYIKRMEF